MSAPLDIAFFGSSLVSLCWNDMHRAATLDRYLREISGHPSIEEVSPTAPEIIDP